MTSVFDQAKAIGDAVLYEGYLLYPYRASAAKNRVRWQFGVLMPPAYASPDRGEHAHACTEMLLEPGKGAAVHLRLRFLQVQERAVYQRQDDGRYRPVPSLAVGAATFTSWDEAVEREVDAVLPVSELLAGPVEVPVSVEGTEKADEVPGGRLVRRTRPVAGLLRARAEPLDGPYGGVRLRVEVVNTGRWHTEEPCRQDALRRALLAAHLVVAVSSGRFLSLLDPPEWAAPAAKACRNERLWPVLLGEPGRDDAMLASPIILYDYPAVAAESQGELYDGTEIDEILTLRTMTLTDEEKREVRATDERVRTLVDRIDAMPPELLERLHGTVRYLRSVTGEESPAAPGSRTVLVGGTAVPVGARVRLRPGTRRADAQDMFLDGRTATVRAVLSDVDGTTHVAVTVDDDPAADLQHAQGRYRYFAPEELEPLPEREGSA
ncbi:hypothetical protein FNH05_24410 [Amycolatopsis rhizosphaerae]|uniref:Uncharacterized protein n=1 Tax=Amycolatopsis rhizosphaerae TaxID=2053003 RepID=A0A558BNY4_9PSEU|nr:hypothetical protein [Amycolatopsis rhizosphaerae]TVT38212.1 hypothetical protein FNH05_24410 [Amycolatopsis rhizosphaerae]